MFEFNDEFTRANFRNIVEPFLREVQGRRGITDFLVVCDETNNTGEVIDRNEFIAEIFKQGWKYKWKNDFCIYLCLPFGVHTPKFLNGSVTKS